MEPEIAPVRETYLHWLYMALGIKYTLLLPLAALVSFVVALIIVVRGRGPLAGAALLFIVPMPFLVGIYGAIEGAIEMYQVVAAISTQPKASEMARGISMTLATPLVGMLLMVPAYAVAVVGLFIRAMIESNAARDSR